MKEIWSFNLLLLVFGKQEEAILLRHAKGKEKKESKIRG
jgi:hypothetical protein